MSERDTFHQPSRAKRLLWVIVTRGDTTHRERCSLFQWQLPFKSLRNKLAFLSVFKYNLLTIIVYMTLTVKKNIVDVLLLIE